MILSSVPLYFISQNMNFNIYEVYHEDRMSTRFNRRYSVETKVPEFLWRS